MISELEVLRAEIKVIKEDHKALDKEVRRLRRAIAGQDRPGYPDSVLLAVAPSAGSYSTGSISLRSTAYVLRALTTRLGGTQQKKNIRDTQEPRRLSSQLTHWLARQESDGSTSQWTRLSPHVGPRNGEDLSRRPQV